jgi:hypothetical protein
LFDMIRREGGICAIRQKYKKTEKSIERKAVL